MASRHLADGAPMASQLDTRGTRHLVIMPTEVWTEVHSAAQRGDVTRTESLIYDGGADPDSLDCVRPRLSPTARCAGSTSTMCQWRGAGSALCALAAHTNQLPPLLSLGAPHRRAVRCAPGLAVSADPTPPGVRAGAR